MINSDEFSELVLYYDSREQSNVEGRPRVKRIIEWFKQRGGTMISEMAISLTDYVICGGYDEKTKTYLPGMFRDKEICLGVEYKTMQDYSGSGSDLDWKLIEAYKYFNQVSLFVEEGNLAISYVDGKAFIKNPAVANGKADVLVYEHYKNEIDRFSQIADIHVRTFSYLNFVDVNLDSLMILLSAQPNVRLYYRGNGKDDTRASFITSLIAIPGIGIKNAMKIADVFPNYEILVAHSHGDELEKIIGKATGLKLRSFIKDSSRKDICKENYNKFFNISSNHSDTNSQPTTTETPPIHQLVSNDSGVTSKGDATLSSLSTTITDATKAETLITVKDGYGKLSDQVEKALIPQSHMILCNTFVGTHDTSRGSPNIKGSLGVLQSSDSSGFSPPSRTIHDTQSSEESLFRNSDDTSSHTPSTLSIPPPINDGGDQGDDMSTHFHNPPAFKDTVKTLGDAIVDFCYDKPKSDTEIMAAFTFKGYKIPEIHKELKSNVRLHKHKQGGIVMFGFKGIKAKPEMDIGV